MKVKKIAIVYSGGKYWGGIETYLSLLFDLYDKEKVELCIISLGNWDLSKKIKKRAVRCLYFPGSECG